MSVTRRRIRRVVHEEVGLQIAPMIDVTLLLLFFFMLSGKLTKSAKLKTIQVPLASSVQTTENSGERDVINVDAEGKWFAGDTPVNTAELASHLKARFHNHPPLKLGEHTKQLEQHPAAAGRGVDRMLMDVEIAILRLNVC